MKKNIFAIKIFMMQLYKKLMVQRGRGKKAAATLNGTDAMLSPCVCECGFPIRLSLFLIFARL